MLDGSQWMEPGEGPLRGAEELRTGRVARCWIRSAAVVTLRARGVGLPYPSPVAPPEGRILFLQYCGQYSRSPSAAAASCGAVLLCLVRLAPWVLRGAMAP